MTCLNCDNEALKESGLCLECEEIESRKINGILYLPALGLIVTLIMTPYSFYILANMMFSNFQQYGIITSYGIFILACVLIYFVIAAVASQAFFRRQKITKKLMVAYYTVNFITTACMTVLPAILFNLSLESSDISAISSAIVGILAWIPYFLLSKRIPVVFHK
ncbi:DUF2569 domain-containing protein [Yersinia enterocolitica]|uniref:DUF2569 domain-containing protein n=1 Tax=Yersinia enterocolitica TaxID=630 RepID=UPI0005E4B701|nr:DUF2569 domain-containing protein [Yersinia enterocolitica]ELI8169221.1 DUF2569 domain-containing protein [Yersinia enterocolitica]ELW7386959.1 DUF2569 domain-containing protein [Yersinia enterocolitica]ELZ1903769.1 DUF2569 domain-containing protein [Yersinia enterocolitica]EMA7645805.1 DUF2569 domain-containing protein [Yersinia enterocolitica]CFB70697.1 Protein of uncharacterised function (DUF2569) [Yersinia enterocolitica]